LEVCKRTAIRCMLLFVFLEGFLVPDTLHSFFARSFQECFDVILPSLPHALSLLRDDAARKDNHRPVNSVQSRPVECDGCCRHSIAGSDGSTVMSMHLAQLCPTRGLLAGFDPVQSFVRPSLVFFAVVTISYIQTTCPLII